jgi:polyphosphate glucokinase
MPHTSTLAIDIGGTGLKAAIVGPDGRLACERVRVETPYPCTPKVMVDHVVELVSPLPPYDHVSVGFPGVVKNGRVVTAPHFGNEIWGGFDLAGALEKKLGKPVKLLNDAEMQGLAAIRGKGVEMVITLGTGFGSAIFQDGRLTPHLELAHHPVHGDKTYNDYLGDKALKKVGKKKWNRRVRRVLGVLRTLVNFDRLYIGGGNARHIAFDLPPDTKTVPNADGLLGGAALWEDGAADR